MNQFLGAYPLQPFTTFTKSPYPTKKLTIMGGNIGQSNPFGVLSGKINYISIFKTSINPDALLF